MNDQMFWPEHASETRMWESRGTRGIREDRMLKKVSVSIPPQIAALGYVPSAGISTLIERATVDLTTLDAGSGRRIAALSGFLIRSESVASSKIEHVDASMDDFAKAMAGNRSNSSATSMVAAVQALTALIDRSGAQGEIKLADILDAHHRLMVDDAHEAAYAGKLRTVQNWIGGSDYSPRNAIYVPPPPELVAELMDDLVRFANRADLPAIAQAALAHAQFESIHPFTDGNGRIGRSLINAILRRRGLTTTTVVPLASVMLADRDAYFSLLTDYRTGEVDNLVRTVAWATSIASLAAVESAERLSNLPEVWRSESPSRQGSAGARIIDSLLDHPVIDVAAAARITNSSTASTYEAMARLEGNGVVYEVTERKRDKIWAAGDVLAELDRLNRQIAEVVRKSTRP